jgi:hypothetical protein
LVGWLFFKISKKESEYYKDRWYGKQIKAYMNKAKKLEKIVANRKALLNIYEK